MNILKGIIFTVILSLIISLIFAIVFRLPIPMVGIIGPFGENHLTGNIIETLKMVFTAWLFYGLFGGFIVLSVFGGLAGHLASKSSGATTNKNMITIKYSFIAGLIPVLFISILDFFIGSW